MVTDLFPECQGGPSRSAAPLESWMVEALKGYPAADAEALGRIPRRALRRECFCYLMDYRERGPEVLADMEPIVRDAVRRGVSPIGGVSLAGVLRLKCDPPHEIGNETACFYVFVLSLLHTELAAHLKSNGEAVEAMRKAGWKP
jgi:hypothetical protein